MADGPVACGVATIVTWRQQVLFGRRLQPDGSTVWQLPGGWIERDESPLAAARREVLEETGLVIEAPAFVAVTSNRFSADIHSISLYFEAECRDVSTLSCGEGQIDRGWQWRQWDDLGDDLFLPLALLRRTNYRPFSGVNNPTHFSF